MLLKAEKILSHGEVLLDASEQEIFRAARHELAEKLVEKMINERLVKVEIASEVHDDFGTIAKVRVTTRAYYPDD